MNTTGRHHFLLLAAVASAWGIAPGRTHADVKFFDGGYAELCSNAAHNVEEQLHTEITGSRLAVTPLELCTLAIKNGEAASIAGSYNNRGVLYFHEGLLPEALTDFEEAIRRDATLAIAHINRGYALVALGRWAESITAFDSGIALGSTESAKAHYNRGIAHEELGQVREAYNDYSKAAELEPEWEAPKRELERFIVKRQ